MIRFAQSHLLQLYSLAEEAVCWGGNNNLRKIFHLASTDNQWKRRAHATVLISLNIRAPARNSGVSPWRKMSSSKCSAATTKIRSGENTVHTSSVRREGPNDCGYRHPGFILHTEVDRFYVSGTVIQRLFRSAIFLFLEMVLSSAKVKFGERIDEHKA